MADYPSLPLWTDAYLADTRHLTTTEHGAYLLLLMEAWRRPSCALPDDDVLLARLAGLSVDEWTASKPVIMAFWSHDGRRREWQQKRLIKERDFLRQKAASNRNAALTRWKREKKTDANAMQPSCINDAPTPTPTPTINNPLSTPLSQPKKKPRSPVGSRLPTDWILCDEGKAYATMHGLSAAQISREAEAFRDYWTAQAGAKARKADWLATWRTWVRRVQERGAAPHHQQKHAGSTGGQLEPLAVTLARHGRIKVV